MTISSDPISQQVSAELQGSVTIIGKHHTTAQRNVKSTCMIIIFALYTIRDK